MAGELGFTVADSEAAGLILRVEFGQPDHKSPVYVLLAVALHDGQMLERAEARTCFRCTPAELVAGGLEILPSAVAKAREAQREAIPEPVPPPVVDVPDVAEPAAHRGRLGPMTYAGVSLGGLGLASAIAGGVLLHRGVQTNSTDSYYLTGTDYRPVGGTLLGLGLTSMVAATVMLAVDAWVIAPRRTAKSRVKLSHVGVTANALVLAGRF
jgi:hypothetical protein